MRDSARALMLVTAALLVASVPCRGAVLEGRVTAAAGIESPAPLSVAVDDWVCGTDGELPDPRLVIGPERGLANVVVRVVGLDGATPYPSTARVMIDQKGCVFEPHVTVIAPGADLLVRNSDPVLHNFRTISKVNPSMNRAQVRGKEDVFRFRAPEIVRVECDVHYWMSAIIVVAADAHTAVSGADGAFRIDGLAPGSYELKLWHETLGERSVTAVVGDEGGRLETEWPAPE